VRYRREIVWSAFHKMRSVKIFRHREAATKDTASDRASITVTVTRHVSPLCITTVSSYCYSLLAIRISPDLEELAARMERRYTLLMP
jgi:hypothetical protein